MFVADGDEGLRVIDVSDFDNIEEIGYYDTPGEARRLANDGNVVYSADGDNFAIYDCDRAINNVGPEWREVPGDRIEADEGDVIEFELEAEDDNDDELVILMVSEDLPDEAEFTDNGDGTGDFRWETSFEDEGRYNVTFIVSDGDLEAETEVEITVNNVNRRPDPAIIEDLTLQEDAERIDIADLDTAFVDPDGEDLDFEIREGAEELQLDIDRDGVLSLQPINDFWVEEPGLTVTIVAEDQENLSVETSFQVLITPVNDPPEPFNMLTPEDGHEVQYDSDSLCTLDFAWQSAEQNEYEVDTVSYFIEFWVDDDESILRVGPLENTAYLNIPIQLLADTLRLERWDPITFTWQVWAVDSEDSTLANEAPWTFTIPALSVDSDWRSDIPEDYYLSPNFPNPFNASTTIQFGLPMPGAVDMTVWDIRGRRVAILASVTYSAGRYEVIWDASNVAAGIYLVRITSNDFVAVRKMILVK